MHLIQHNICQRGMVFVARFAHLHVRNVYKSDFTRKKRRRMTATFSLHSTVCARPRWLNTRQIHQNTTSMGFSRMQIRNNVYIFVRRWRAAGELFERTAAEFPRRYRVGEKKSENMKKKT